eukprot:TRINITY_DN3604_c0_g1_i1.p1 TRINITY_DN3604_c0_g1~~TRINITY_DN3604_c0_g1_i1.p1  ORF type:complete len:113 (-),score=18.50 TRINITY_DN3604_c0_g1_i1:114-452(-)
MNNPSHRILVVGDTGVGKTALVHMICTGATLKSPKYTIGCNLQVMMYQSPVSNSRCFMEFWDIGASPKFEDSRRMFYKKIQGDVPFVVKDTIVESSANTNARITHGHGESFF